MSKRIKHKQRPGLAPALDGIAARQQLELERDRLAAIVESSSDAIISQDLDGVITSWNTGAEQLYGYRVEEAVGRPITLIVPPGRSEEILRLLAKIKKGQRVRFEALRLTKDGRLIDVSLTWSPIMDAAGQVIGASSIAHDITERKRNLEALRESEERFRAVIKNSPLVVFHQDRQLRFTWIHNPLAVFWSEDVLGKTDADIFPAAEADRIMAEKQRVLDSGEGRRYQIEATINQEKRYFDTNVEPLIDAQGRIVGITGVAVDITEQKRNEGALRVSEEKYRALFQQSKDANFLVALSGEILDINPAGVVMSGYSLRELLGMNVDRLYPDYEVRTAYLEKLEKFGYVRDYEVDMKNKAGEIRRVEINANLMRDQQGQVTAILGNLRDITEKKSLERQLQEAQKLEAVGLLAGGIAHDFNNTLMVIQGNVELGLMELAPDDPQQEALSAILEAARKGAQLVQQLLAFSRRQILNPLLVDTAALITGVAKILKRVIPGSNEFELRLPPDLGNVFVDPGALEQVLINLSINAGDAMPQGGRLTIEAKNVSLDQGAAAGYPEARPGDFVRITVADTGVGMDQETISHIFEPFYTVKKDGVGLGLSIVYGVIKQLGGFIGVASEPGHGSRFEIFLPLRSEVLAPMEEPSRAQAVPATGSETILIAEDEEEVRGILKNLLQSLGYRVLAAADGLEALELFKLRRQEVDLVLIDMVMPGLRGSDVCREMRSLAPGLPCLFITGYSEESLGSISEKPLTYVLTKPVALDELSGKLRELLDRQAA